jgi:hypothetical protein
VKSPEWHRGLAEVINEWADSTPRHVIISPDVDGLASSALLNTIYPIKIIGIYTTIELLLLDDHTQEEARDALWLDHDISQPGVRCIGQHLIFLKDTDVLSRREPKSWNPNVMWKQSWENSFKGKSGKKKDKYPYGTVNFLWDLTNRYTIPTPEQTAILAHADGTWFAIHIYKQNATIWRDLMYADSKWIDILFDYPNEFEAIAVHKTLVDELQSIGYKGRSQSKDAQMLPDDLRYLTGQQGLKFYLKSNHQKYVDSTQIALNIIGGKMGSVPDMGKIAGLYMRGTKIQEYPDRIPNGDLDAFMVEKKIFSHIFGNYNSMKYTIDIKL